MAIDTAEKRQSAMLDPVAPLAPTGDLSGQVRRGAMLEFYTGISTAGVAVLGICVGAISLLAPVAGLISLLAPISGVLILLDPHPSDPIVECDE